MNDFTAARFSKVTKLYGKTHALDGLDLEVRRGELFGLVGVNGAGKTTTLSTVMGFIRHTSGSVRVLGLDPWTDAPRLHARIAWLPGEVRLPDGITGIEWLNYQARVAGLDESRVKNLAAEWEVPVERLMRTLSKGNRQKVALIRLLMSDAELLVLDEPTSGLDPVAQEQLLETLRARARAGKTVLFSSHSLAEVQALCDRMAVIDRGRVLKSGTVSELVNAGERRMDVWTREKIDSAILAAWRPELSGSRHVSLSGERLLEEALPRLMRHGIERVEFGGEGLEGLLSQLHSPNGNNVAMRALEVTR